MNKITERTIKQINKDRRRFLEMLAKAGVSTSVLQASAVAGAMMSSRFAEAQSTSDKKFVLVYHPNGAPKPNGIPGFASNPTMLAPFQPHAANVAALQMTISMPGNHGNLHQAAGALSYNGAEAGGSSIDMQLSKVLGNTTPYKAIQLGVQSLTQGGINFLNGSAVNRIDSPQTALDRYFGSAPPPPSGDGGDAGPSIFDRRRSILDANKAGLDALRNKLGAEERARLEGHLNALETLENRINQEEMAQAGSGGGDTGGGSTGGGSCSAPAVGNGQSPLQLYRTQADIAVAALACNLTNVASIQFSDTQAGWLPNDGTPDAVNWNADHHQANHGGGLALLPDLVAYMNKGLAHLIGGLKSAGILDRTVVLCISEMGSGEDHSAGNGPIVVASGISGFRSGNRVAGSTHYDVFPDIFTLLGVESSVGGMLHNYGGGGIVA